MDTAATAILRADFPVLDPAPDVGGQNYTIENFQRLEAWRTKYGAACVVVSLDLVDRPVFSMDGRGAANALAVVAMYNLGRYRGAIESGQAMWAPLADAITALRKPGGAAAADQLEGLDRERRVLAARLAKLRQAAGEVELALRWDEWAQLNTDKVVEG